MDLVSYTGRCCDSAETCVVGTTHRCVRFTIRGWCHHPCGTHHHPVRDDIIVDHERARCNNVGLDTSEDHESSCKQDLKLETFSEDPPRASAQGRVDQESNH